jgi:hypothetical protein
LLCFTSVSPLAPPFTGGLVVLVSLVKGTSDDFLTDGLSEKLYCVSEKGCLLHAFRYYIEIYR